jgi:hypothetical protein
MAPSMAREISSGGTRQAIAALPAALGFEDPHGRQPGGRLDEIRRRNVRPSRDIAQERFLTEVGARAGHANTASSMFWESRNIVVLYSVTSSAMKISPSLIIAIFTNRKNQVHPQKNKCKYLVPPFNHFSVIIERITDCYSQDCVIILQHLSVFKRTHFSN